MSASDIILKLSNIESYYGPIMAIRGISLEVPRGKIVTLLGANGAGKTTVLMVEHDMTLVNRVSDRVIALNYGKVLAMGTPAEVQRHPDVVAAYLGA